MRTQPWHSIKTGQTVYHDNTGCVDGDNIDPEDRREGTGGRPLCAHCLLLDIRGS